jgi:hypothetical protein
MKLLEEEFKHPTEASLVRLRVFQQPGGFLATEEHRGAATVYRTLGLFDTRQAAEDCVRARMAQLGTQRYQKVQPAA